MPIDTLLSIPGIGAAVKWVGAKLFGVTDAPNVKLLDWKTVETTNDPRPAWHYWLHVRCLNEQRSGRSRWLVTQTAVGCHARVDFVDDKGTTVWWDHVPFTAGGLQLHDTVDLVAGDRRLFLPLFLDLPRPVPDPRGGGTIGPGVFPTGNQFLGGLTNALPKGSYSVIVTVCQGATVLVEESLGSPLIVR